MLVSTEWFMTAQRLTCFQSLDGLAGVEGAGRRDDDSIDRRIAEEFVQVGKHPASLCQAACFFRLLRLWLYDGRAGDVRMSEELFHSLASDPAQPDTSESHDPKSTRLHS